MKLHHFILALCASAMISQGMLAGEAIATDKNTISTDLAPPYEGGRGLLTLEGPTGLFINPTSGTLPKGATTLEYCFLLVNNETDIVGHNVFASVGVTDWLEVGALAIFVNNRPADDLSSSFGPVVRIRLTKDDGIIPQISIGGYAIFGDEEHYNAFLAAYKRIPISPHGFIRAVGFHAGIRETWIRKVADSSNTPIGYGGIEIQLPLRFYLVGEISTKNDNPADLGGPTTPYGYGIQWRLGGINISTGFLNPGAFSKPSFFFGIGSQFAF